MISSRFNSLSASGVMGLAKCCNGSTVTRISGVLGSRVRRFEGFFTCRPQKTSQSFTAMAVKYQDKFLKNKRLPMSHGKDVVVSHSKSHVHQRRHHNSYQQTYQHSLIQINISQLALLSTVNRGLVLMGRPSLQVSGKNTSFCANHNTYCNIELGTI